MIHLVAATNGFILDNFVRDAAGVLVIFIGLMTLFGILFMFSLFIGCGMMDRGVVSHEKS